MSSITTYKISNPLHLKDTVIQSYHKNYNRPSMTQTNFRFDDYEYGSGPIETKKS